MTTHDDVTGDRTHYHGDGCTPPHPAATLAEQERRKAEQWADEVMALIDRADQEGRDDE